MSGFSAMVVPRARAFPTLSCAVHAPARGTSVAAKPQMRAVRWLLLGGVVALLGAACAGKSQDAGSGGGPGRRVPEKHRAAGEQCDGERAPGNSPPYFDQTSPECTTDSDCQDGPGFNCGNDCRMTCFDAGTVKRCAWSRGECVYDSDCSEGNNGRCGNNREHWTCSYDECFSDSECATGGPCACGGAYGPEGPNTCMPGNCQSDADCGNDGYCSPTQGDCGSYSGIIGYYCHTPQDTCIDDADCGPRENQGPGYCMYRPELGHWQCGYGQCVG